MARFSLSFFDVNSSPTIASNLQFCIGDVFPGALADASGQSESVWRAMNTFAVINGLDCFRDKIGVGDWGVLTKKATPATLRFIQTSNLPLWMKRIAAYNAAKRFDLPDFVTEDFLDAYADEFPEYLPPNNKWRPNLSKFLDYVRADKEMNDIRWVAYLLATVMHECRRKKDNWKAYWLPIEETKGGINANKDYWNEKVVRNKLGKALDTNYQVIENEKTQANRIVKHRYYGRGFVQITWHDNYRKMDSVLGLGGKLHLNPDLTLQNPQISYDIASYGMRHGCFIDDPGESAKKAEVCNGAKLSDYLQGAKTNYAAARRIINVDVAANGKLVAGYAKKFEEIIKAVSPVIIAPEPRP